MYELQPLLANYFLNKNSLQQIVNTNENWELGLRESSLINHATFPLVPGILTNFKVVRSSQKTPIELIIQLQARVCAREATPKILRLHPESDNHNTRNSLPAEHQEPHSSGKYRQVRCPSRYHKRVTGDTYAPNNVISVTQTTPCMKIYIGCNPVSFTTMIFHTYL